jgi:photosystem II stability/assembly factor-like uncharacterized protein
VGGVEIWKTTDGGTTWTNLTNVYKRGPIHPDQHALAFMSPSSSSYYVGNDGGVWAGNAQGKFTNLNAGGLNTIQFFGGGIGEVGSHAQLYGGTQDNGTNRYPGSVSGTAQWTEVLGGDGGETVVDYTDNAVVYAEILFPNIILAKSVDGGANWSRAMNGFNPNEPHNFVVPLIMSPNNNQELFAATDRLYRTTDGAGTWQVISPSDNGTALSQIAVAPGNDNTIYVGDTKGNVFATTDGGAHWTGGFVSGSTGGMVRGLAVDPSNSQVVYASFANFSTGTGQHVFKSTDGGAHWTDISQNLINVPCSSILRLGTDIVVGTDVGIFDSTDEGATWTYVSGLPIVAIEQLFLNRSGSKLFVATHGRGMWMFPLS